MGLFGKLKEILFDEETVEIPVITKEEKHVEKKKEKKREVSRDEDEVKIEKIETPPKRKPVVIEDDEEDLFDMPKLKEEPKEEKNVETKTFTFPVFDDEDNTPKREERPKRQTREIKEEEPSRAPKEKRASGYTSAYDYSYGKYKGDYKSSREENASRLSKVLVQKEEKKAFTPSPIISPVYGVLNENYKKEDIVSKSEKKKSGPQVLDLDSVRRKAYGTLEDEIEVSLSKKEEYKEEVVDDYDIMEDEGISIDDLLVDRSVSEDEELKEFMNNLEDRDLSDEEEDTELFDPREVEDEVPDEIELEDDERNITIEEDNEEVPDGLIDAEEEIGIEEEVEDKKPAKVNVEKTEDKKEAIGEEDLFDLIDSLYEGKGED